MRLEVSSDTSFYCRNIRQLLCGQGKGESEGDGGVVLTQEMGQGQDLLPGAGGGTRSRDIQQSLGGWRQWSGCGPHGWK